MKQQEHFRIEECVQPKEHQCILTDAKEVHNHGKSNHGILISFNHSITVWSIKKIEIQWHVVYIDNLAQNCFFVLQILKVLHFWLYSLKAHTQCQCFDQNAFLSSLCDYREHCYESDHIDLYYNTSRQQPLLTLIKDQILLMII